MRTGRRPVRGHRHGHARPRGQAAEDDSGQAVADADCRVTVADQPCRIRGQSTVGGEPAHEAGADEDAGCPARTFVGAAPGECVEEEPEEEAPPMLTAKIATGIPSTSGTARLIASRAAVPPMPPRRARPRKDMRRWAGRFILSPTFRAC